MADKNEKKYEYVYSSSEVSKYYGLTVKGMEYYEKCGLVIPERAGQSKVRRYSLLDNYRLYFSRLYKNAGFSIQQTVDMLENNTVEHLGEAFDKRIDAIRRDILIKERTAEELEYMRRMMCLAGEEPFFEIVEEEGFYRLFVRQFSGPHRSSHEETREYKTWNDYLPLTNASLRFPLEDCRSDSEAADTEIGLIVREKDFNVLGLCVSGRTRHIPAGRFLHTLLCGEALTLSSKARLKPALEYMQAHGFRQTGDAFTRMITLLQCPGGDIRCDEAWFPVE